MSKTSHIPLPWGLLLCASKHNAGPGRFVNSAVWFSFPLLLLLRFTPAKCLGPSFPLSHLHPLPLSYCFLYSHPRPPPAVDHPPPSFLASFYKLVCPGSHHVRTCSHVGGTRLSRYLNIYFFLKSNILKHFKRDFRLRRLPSSNSNRK